MPLLTELGNIFEFGFYKYIAPPELGKRRRAGGIPAGLVVEIRVVRVSARQALKNIHGEWFPGAARPSPVRCPSRPQFECFIGESSAGCAKIAT